MFHAENKSAWKWRCKYNLQTAEAQPSQASGCNETHPAHKYKYKKQSTWIFLLYHKYDNIYFCLSVMGRRRGGLEITKTVKM